MKTEIFKNHPNLKEVHVASDGTPFYHALDAKNYAKGLKDKNVEVVKNPGTSEGQKQGDVTGPTKAEDVIKAVQAVEAIEQLEPFKSDDRKTVKDAVAKKLEELTNNKA